MPGSTRRTPTARAIVPSTESTAIAASIQSAAARRSPRVAISRASRPASAPLAVNRCTP